MSPRQFEERPTRVTIRRAKSAAIAAWSPILILLATCGGNTGKGSQGKNLDAGNLVIVLSAVDACVNTPSPTDTGGSGPDPLCDPNAAQVSYSRDIAPILAGCSGEVCHAPWDYGTIVNQPSHACCDRRFLVAPFRPSFSLLTQSLTGTDSCVGTMPQGGQLATAEIQTITDWVCQGAFNN
jgi:hypothetical protein